MGKQASFTLTVGWFQPPAERDFYEYSLAYLFTKTHYSLYGKYSDKVIWTDPIYNWYDLSSIEEAIDRFKNVDVIFFSNYVWNYSVNEIAAKIVKEKYPHIKTVVGGPQLEYSREDFFERYSMFDYHCEPTMSAELYIEDWINQYFDNAKNPDHEQICFDKRSQIRKSFNYPYVSIYKDNYKFIKEAKQYFDSKGIKSRIGYETTRGCPFKCTFCEWGGGTGTKLKKKDIEQIREDLDVIQSLGFEEIDLIDSNLGAFKNKDWQLLDLIHQRGLKIMVLSLLKTKDLNVKKTIIDNLMSRGYRANLSVQTFSKTALSNAQRPDLNLEQQFELCEYIRQRVIKEHGDSFFERPYNKIKEIASVEFIMGMPGSTKEDFYAEFAMMERLMSWNDGRFEYSYLPYTIASSDDDKAKFKVNLVPVYTESIFGTKNYFQTISDCYSYTKEDMYEMYLINQAGTILRKDFYDDFKDNVDIVTFMKSMYEILKECTGFDFINSQIKDFFNPNSASDFYNLKDFDGNLKYKKLVIENFITTNSGIIRAHLYSKFFTHQTDSSLETKSLALV